MKKPRIKKVARGMLECGPFEASRFYLSEGDDFSGWVIRNRNDRSEVTERFLKKIRRRHLDSHNRWLIEAYDYFMLEGAKAYYGKVQEEIDEIENDLLKICAEFNIPIMAIRPRPGERSDDAKTFS